MLSDPHHIVEHKDKNYDTNTVMVAGDHIPTFNGIIYYTDKEATTKDNTFFAAGAGDDHKTTIAFKGINTDKLATEIDYTDHPYESNAKTNDTVTDEIGYPYGLDTEFDRLGGCLHLSCPEQLGPPGQNNGPCVVYC